MTVPCPLMKDADVPRVLMVVPTLGTRLDYLETTLSSIGEQDERARLVVVAPSSAHKARSLSSNFGATIVDDPGTLAAAINLGVASSTDPEYVSWIGDDDLLEPGSLRATVHALDTHPTAALAYGWCRYIDPGGRQLWLNRTGDAAQRVLSWGPQLIPQPGMLVRRSAWDAVGGLDESLTLAFDFDLILKLRGQGSLVCVPTPVAAFRWHPDSLTVSSRTRNLEESEAVKRRYLRPWQRKVAWSWERPVRVATRLAAFHVNRRASKMMSSTIEHSAAP